MGRPRTGTIYTTSKGKRVRVTMPDGSRPTYDLGTTFHGEAKRKSKKLIAELDAGIEPTTAIEVVEGPPKFQAYAEKVNAARRLEGVASARDEIQRLNDYVFDIIGPMSLDDIRPRHVLDVLTAAREKGLSGQTVKHIRNAMFKVMRAAVVDEYVKENVVALVDPPKNKGVKKARVPLTDKEFSALLNYLTELCEEEDRDVSTVGAPRWMRNERVREAAEKWMPRVAACLESGLSHVDYAKENGLRSDVLLTWIQRAREYISREQARVYGRRTPASELRMMSIFARALGGARTSDVIRTDWLHAEVPHFAGITIVNSKTGKQRRLIVPERVRPFVVDWWQRSGCPSIGPMFPILRGPRMGQRRPTRGVSFAGRLREACVAAGLTRRELFTETDFTLPVDFHSFRRAFVKAGRRAGVSADITMKLSGHASREVHEIYVGDDPAFEEIPDAMIPELPALRTPEPVSPMSLLGPARTVMAHGKSQSQEGKHRYATGDSNARPSAPEADEAARHGLSGSDFGSVRGVGEGSPGSVEGHRGPKNQHVLPTDLGFDPVEAPAFRARVVDDRGDLATLAMDRARAVVVGELKTDRPEEDVAALLGAACDALGLDADRSDAIGGAR
jgi:integrase